MLKGIGPTSATTYSWLPGTGLVMKARSPSSDTAYVSSGLRANLEAHDGTCGDRVTGVALHPSDHEELKLVEVWGLPVLSWPQVERGRCELLCEAKGVLTPNIETFEELADHWAFALPRPVAETEMA